MFSAWSRWIWGLADRLPAEDTANDQQEQEAPPVPFPPITPTQRLDTFADRGDQPDAVAASGFFQRLPPDVRRMILIAAWGDRTVHVDLRHGLPLVEDARAHGNEAAARWHETAVTSPEWRWYGCVCHQFAPRRLRTSTIRSARQESFVYRPCLDVCVLFQDNPSSPCCDRWAGEKPGKCRVGAMGWLRSCRQA